MAESVKVAVRVRPFISFFFTFNKFKPWSTLVSYLVIIKNAGTVRQRRKGKLQYMGKAPAVLV